MHMLDETAALFISNTGAMDRILRHAVKDLGISWTALRVLADLVVAGPLTQKQLVEIEQLKQSTISVLLREMETDGLIQFKINKKDARSKLVYITRKGKTNYERCGRVIRPLVSRMLGRLSQQELDTIYKSERLLNRLLNEYRP